MQLNLFQARRSIASLPTFVLRPFWWPMNMNEVPSMLPMPHTMAGSSRPPRSPCSSTNCGAGGSRSGGCRLGQGSHVAHGRRAAPQTALVQQQQLIGCMCGGAGSEGCHECCRPLSIGMELLQPPETPTKPEALPAPPPFPYLIADVERNVQEGGAVGVARHLQPLDGRQPAVRVLAQLQDRAGVGEQGGVKLA